jgi:tetratricopeptide (TPR) repeat protein
VSKDNFLFAVIGLLFGFITGYLMHEVMETRQPPRRTGAEVAEAPAGPAAGMLPQGLPAESPAALGATAGANGEAGGPAMAQIRELQERVQKNPEDADALLELANMNFDIRNWARAVELYTRFLKLRPGSPDVLTDLGVCLKESAQPERALEAFRGAQKLSPDHWRSLYNEVFVLAFELGRTAEADQALVRLRRLQPGNPAVEKLAGEMERQRAAA